MSPKHSEHVRVLHICSANVSRSGISRKRRPAQLSEKKKKSGLSAITFTPAVMEVFSHPLYFRYRFSIL